MPFPRNLLLFLLLIPAAFGQSDDVILRHGTILDGTGLPPYRADLAIRHGYIAAIGNLDARTAALDLDVTGLYVAPGFINIHSHAAPAALPTAENMLQQGVTTEILNPDGGGATDLAQQLGRSSSAGLAVNIGAYIGFNSVWAEVVGQADRRPTPEQITRMRALIERGLQQGAWGVSAGLDYKPGYFARTEEVVSVVSVAAPWRTNFPNHERLTPETNFSSHIGIAETIRIASDAGLVPEVTHMKIQGREQGAAPEVLRSMDQAGAAGHYTAADAYPYLAGQTGLGSLTVPAWAQDGGRSEMLKRFQDPEQRARIAKEIEDALNARFDGAAGVYLPQTKQQLADIMRDRHAPAGETVIQLLEQGNVPAILRFGSEDDLVQILRHPTTAIACDCGASLDTRNHPRFFGTFPRVLGHYVRETHALTWEDAIRKMTGLPASTVGLVDRGFLVPGMLADVTVFDPNTIIDHATYENPALPSDGIRYVLVNGQLAFRDGKGAGVHSGRVLLRSAHMPSRPMSVASSRRVSLATATLDSNVRVSLEVAQAAGARQAAGSFRLTDPRTKTTIRSSALTFVQTADHWAAITGRARVLPARTERALTVVLDGKNVIVDLEDAYHLSGSVDPNQIRLRVP